MKFDKVTRLFTVLSVFFVANAIIAEFIGVKIFSLEKTLGFEPLSMSILGNEGLSLNLTAGVLIWPIVFLMTDIINEYFGKKKVRFLSYLAVGVILYAFAVIFLAIGVSPNEWWQYESGKLLKNGIVDDMDVAFNSVFGQGLWIIIGSVVAFLVGQIVDVVIFQRIKKVTGEGYIWLRATGSTLVSQLIDSYIVLIIAFYLGADWDISTVIAIGTVNYIYKFILAIIMTPIIYIIHNAIDKYLGNEIAHKLKKEALH